MDFIQLSNRQAYQTLSYVFCGIRVSLDKFQFIDFFFFFNCVNNISILIKKNKTLKEIRHKLMIKLR